MPMVLSFFLGVIKDVQDEMLKGEKSGQIFAVIHIGMKHLDNHHFTTLLLQRHKIMLFFITNSIRVHH